MDTHQMKAGFHPHRTPRRVGRPPKASGEKLGSISLSLPPSMIEQLRAEQIEGGADSLSAVVRVAVGDYMHRLGKRRNRAD